MRIEQLHYLVSLRQTGSISKTADNMLISHQSISKSIKTLEKELSVTLLERSAQGVKFTNAGCIVCDYAEKVISETTTMQEKIAPYQTLNKQKKQTQTLNLYVVPRYITPSFLEFIKNMRFSYPWLKINIRNIVTNEALQKLSFDENTIILCTNGSQEKTEFPMDILNFIKEKNLNYHILSKQNLHACVHNSSRFVKNHSFFDEQEANSNSCVSFTYLFEIEPQDYNPQFVIDSFEQQKNLIKQGNCFGRYTTHEFELFFSKNYSLLPLKNPIILYFLALYSADNILINTFLKELTQKVIF